MCNFVKTGVNIGVRCASERGRRPIALIGLIEKVARRVGNPPQVGNLPHFG